MAVVLEAYVNGVSTLSIDRHATSRTGRVGCATSNGSPRLVRRFLRHTLSGLAAHGGRLHSRDDDARAERREADVRRCAVALCRSSGCWFATIALVRILAWSAIPARVR